MTGDYAPFSLERAGMLEGLDVESGTALARSLGAQAIFVRTSWPTLMDDHRAHRFDVAMSGISITSERAAVASFTRPYHRGGKTAIVRCGRETDFDTLEELDRPQVRLIVNPGGTNERFARERLSHARLRIHPDNRSIFEEIARGRADVMVTDDIEVELQTRRHRELCRATPEVFTEAAKSILVPRDAELLGLVDRWLGSEIERGEISRRLERALAR
jgi:cyclohexadienyl dehydratase